MKLQEVITKMVAASMADMARNGQNPSNTSAHCMGCAIGALRPLIKTLFDEHVTYQDRLLFSLLLTGSCAEIELEGDNIRQVITVSPKNLSEALDLFQKLTSRDISLGLPPNFIAFARGTSQQHVLN